MRTLCPEAMVAVVVVVASGGVAREGVNDEGMAGEGRY